MKTRTLWLVLGLGVWVTLGAGCRNACEARDAARPIAADTALSACPGRVGVPEVPQAQCDAGFFPDVDYTCGPPAGSPDGGWSCGCTRHGDGACLKRCACDADCGPLQACVLTKLFWGSDTSGTYSVGLCR